jgi:tRNA modification GTPase
MSRAIGRPALQAETTRLSRRWSLGGRASPPCRAYPVAVNLPDDTIAALATGAAPAGVAVIRVSGPRALACARRLAALPDPMPPRTVRLAHLYDPDSRDPLDDALAIYFAAPASFTGEDVVELHCHGGLKQVESVLEAVRRAGARAAEPGEFSRRAVLHGRMSLERAEALADLVEVETEAGLAAARAQLFGALGQAVDAVAAEALDLQAEVEAALDVPDEVGCGPLDLGARAAALAGRCAALRATHRYGRSLREGVRVVFAGAPNAGKSSLFNALLGEDRAIVDGDPGTTRDVLEARLELAGVPCTLVDTAGIRQSATRVEQRGIDRARAEMSRGALCLWVVDATAPEPSPDPRAIPVINKADLVPGTDGLRVSALTGQGLDALRDELGRRLRADAPASGEVVVTRSRHAEQLELAERAFLLAAENAVRAPLEIVAYDLRDAMRALDQIVGRGVDDALLDAIFSKFCIGK